MAIQKCKYFFWLNPLKPYSMQLCIRIQTPSYRVFYVSDRFCLSLIGIVTWNVVVIPKVRNITFSNCTRQAKKLYKITSIFICRNILNYWYKNVKFFKFKHPLVTSLLLFVVFHHRIPSDFIAKVSWRFCNVFQR